MLKKSSAEAGLFRPRVFIAFLFLSAGVCLAMFAFNNGAESSRATSVLRQEHYMPVPGGEPDDLNRMEEEWNNRVTYPTGVFNPEWVRRAAVADARIARSIPFGVRRDLKLQN